MILLSLEIKMITTMKIISFSTPAQICLMFLSICVLLFSCAGKDNEATDYCIDKGDRYLVFLDKSGSIKTLDKTALAPISNDLLGYLGAVLDNGNRISGYFLHDNTLGSSPFINDAYKIECPKLNSSMGVKTIQNTKSEYFNSIKKLKLKSLEVIKNNFGVNNTAPTVKGTDIWSTFELMSRFFKGTPVESKKVVLYVSDMKESSPKTNGRNFDRELPKDQHEAQKWALQDAEKIRKAYKLNNDALQGISVYLLFPEAQLTATDRAQMRYYWESLFEALGITKVEESLPNS